MPGNPGAFGGPGAGPGDAPAGAPGGAGASGGGGGWNFSGRDTIDALLGIIPVIGQLNALGNMFGFSFGEMAQGDPNPATGMGVNGPGGVGGVGGGPANSGLFRYTAPAPVAPAAITAPKPKTEPEPATKPQEPKKRIGRQETILTSRATLSDSPIYKPTLLGQ